MPADNGELADARRSRRLDEFHAFQGDGLPAHDARHRQPLHRTDGHKDQDNIAPEHDHQDDDEEDEGQRIEHIHDAHHQLVHASADKAGGRAPDHADNQRHGGCNHANHKRHAKTDQRARQQVPALRVGAEQVPVLQPRRNLHPVAIDEAGIVHPQQRPDKGQESQNAQQHKAGDGCTVTQKARACIVPQGPAAHRCAFHHFGLFCRRRCKRHQSYFTFGLSAA